MQKIIYILLFFTSSLLLSQGKYNAFGQNALPELVHSHLRVAISLAGKWERTVDDMQQSKSDVYIPFSDTVSGKLVYKKTFRISKDFINNKNTNVYFPGIVGDCKVYINNDFVVKVSGVGIPIMIPISDSRLVEGVNEISIEFEPMLEIIKLKNLSLVTNPQINRGILREPLIVGTSKIFVNELNYKNQTGDRLSATLKVVAFDANTAVTNYSSTGSLVAGNKARITVEYGLINKSTRQPATVPESRDLLVENARTATMNFNLPLSHLPEWTPEHPELYELYIKLWQNGVVIDEYFINVGRRTLKCVDDNIVLNDTAIALNAITYYEYHGSYRSTLPHNVLESDIKKIKLLGANAIRFRFAPPNPYLMTLCDKYGLLVLIDLPLNNLNRYVITNKEFISQSRNVLSQMLATYQTSPSFAGIGLGDGIEEQQGYGTFMDELLKQTKRYDLLKYKVIEAGTLPTKMEDLDFLICKTNSDYNTNEKLAGYINLLRNGGLASPRPIVLNCFTNVLPGNLNGYSDMFSADYQSYFFQNCYNLSRQQKLAGILINSFNDYKTHFPILALNYWDKYRSTDGITDLYRQDKPSALMLKSLFLNDKLPLLNRGNFEQVQITSYIVLGLLALLILIYILNRYNRFREYFFRALLRSYNFFSDVRDKRIMPMYQTTILGVLISVGAALCLSSLLFSMQLEINYSFLLASILPFPAALSFLFDIICQPELLLLFGTILFIVVALVLALIISLISLFLRSNFSFKNCFGIVVWISTPILILLPIGIILSKLFLVAGNIVVAVLAVIYVILIINWLHRFFKALSIIFDWTTMKVYCFGLICIIAIVVVPAVYYESQLKILPFIEYFFNMP